MSGINIQANTGQMRSNADELRRITAEYHQCTQEVLASARSLSGMWEGDAKEDFMRILNQDAPQFDQLNQELNKFCDAVIESATEYERTQAAIQAQMNSTARR